MNTGKKKQISMVDWFNTTSVTIVEYPKHRIHITGIILCITRGKHKRQGKKSQNKPWSRHSWHSSQGFIQSTLFHQDLGHQGSWSPSGRCVHVPVLVPVPVRPSQLKWSHSLYSSIALLTLTATGGAFKGYFWSKNNLNIFISGVTY